MNNRVFIRQHRLLLDSQKVLNCIEYYIIVVAVEEFDFVKILFIHFKGKIKG